MPRIYPPTFEDVASWVAWRVETPVSLIYLGETEKLHRVEYLVNSKVVPHSYQSSLIQDFSPGAAIEQNKPTIIFVETLLPEQYPIFLTPPPGFQRPVKYYHTDGQTIGFAMTNAAIDLEPAVGVADGWNSLTKLPVWNLLLLLAGIAFVFGLLALRDAVGWPRRDLLLEIGRRRSDPEESEAPPASDKPEFDFHLRIRIPARKRNQH
jgi:hypothetical protein